MADSDALRTMPAATIGRRLLSKELNAVEVTDHFLANISAYADPAVFLTVTAERARSEAEASAARYAADKPRGPLDGVPIVWKDLVDIAGTVTTAGSALFRNNPPAQADARVVGNATEAGMVTLGKVTLPEFAFSALGQNPHYGTPRNPLDTTTRRATGGSSSGTGAAVAAGLVPCGLGSDTNGSVRIPASFCGLVGLKTTEKRIPTQGTFVLSHTLDTLGPLARTVEDCALLDAVFRGIAPQDIPATPPAALKVAIPAPDSSVFTDAEAAVLANFHSAVDALRAAGATIETVPLVLFEEIRRLNEQTGTLLAAESYFNLHDLLEGPSVDRIDRRVSERALLGREMSLMQLLRVQTERERLITAFTDQIAAFSCVAMPTTAISAPAWEPLEADVALFRSATAKANKNTMLGSFLRSCAISLPSGKAQNGMPTGIMLMAPGGQDDALLSHATAIEAVLAS
ncbi:MAG: amidase family protein [Proteobacteria bacterium]|nr:amidase family protein [Pseudomonadota bacterium]